MGNGSFPREGERHGEGGGGWYATGDISSLRKGQHPGKWEIIPVGKRGDVLPGAEEVNYIRVPTIALMVLGPMLGGVYMMFLPFIGFAMLFWVAGKKVVEVVKAAVPTRMAEERRLK